MRLSYEQLKTLVTNYVKGEKIGVDTLPVTRDNVVGLVDKIGKITTLDTNYQVDKLGFMDGESMPYARTIEEWSQDLTLPQDYDASGSDALAPNYPTYRKPYYSFTLGKKVIATTLPFNNIERAVHNADEFASITSMITKKLFDSEAVYKYGIKREMLAKYIAKCENAMTQTTSELLLEQDKENGALVWYDEGLPYNPHGVMVKPYKANDCSSWEDAVEKGYVVELKLVEEVTAPTDEATSEAFIKKIKEDVEIATDLNEGHSLSGQSLGATEGLVLVVKQGVIPTIEVDALAGAFQENRLAIPCEIVVVKDFGSNDSAFAVLMDKRSLRLHEDYRRVADMENGKGNFINYFLHLEHTAFASNNTFVKVYKKA